MLELDSIGKSFAPGSWRARPAPATGAAATVLADVSGTLPAGVTLLTGPNGAGKTTLLRVLAGLIRPDCGSLRYAGSPLQPRSRWFRARLGYLPQRTAVYPEMTVKEFLAHMAALKGVPPDTARERALKILEQVGLTACAGSPLGRISQGQARLACIVQALLNDPDVLLLDEPFEGLDHSAAAAAAALFARPGRIVLLTSHQKTHWRLPVQQLWLLRGGVLERR